MTELSPAQKALAAFNEREEVCRYFDQGDDWVKHCLAAALEAVADEVVPGPWKINSCCDQREYSIRATFSAIAAELRGTTTTETP